MLPRFATRTLAMAPGDRRPRTRQSLRSSSCENGRLAHHHYHQIRLETDEETKLIWKSKAFWREADRRRKTNVLESENLISFLDASSPLPPPHAKANQKRKTTEMKKKMNEPALVLQHVGARRGRSRRFHLQRHIERLHFPSVPQRLHILLAQLPLHASFLLTNSYSLHFPTLAFVACFLCKTTINAIVCTDYRRIYSSNFFVIQAVELRYSSIPCALLLKHCFQNGKKKNCLKRAWKIQNLKQ